MKRIGIVAHSAEGGALCFLTACREGSRTLGEHNHPEILVSAIPMALSMPGWNTGNHTEVAHHLSRGVEQVAAAGADFFVCPDNTAHIVLEKMMDKLTLPGLHIAEVVCHEIRSRGFSKAALLGTNWTMTGPVYENVMASMKIERLIPAASVRTQLHDAIFNELCNGVFTSATTQVYLDAIEQLKDRGAECVILGCTEIPLIVTAENSPLPILDSTRLLARYAVRYALHDGMVNQNWITLNF